MAVQHLILWLRSTLAVKMLYLCTRIIRASIWKYERAIEVDESRGNMDYFVTQGRLAKNKYFWKVYMFNSRVGTWKEILSLMNFNMNY
jgi:hypothetical protein